MGVISKFWQYHEGAMRKARLLQGAATLYSSFLLRGYSKDNALKYSTERIFDIEERIDAFLDAEQQRENIRTERDADRAQHTGENDGHTGQQQ